MIFNISICCGHVLYQDGGCRHERQTCQKVLSLTGGLSVHFDISFANKRQYPFRLNLCTIRH